MSGEERVAVEHVLGNAFPAETPSGDLIPTFVEIEGFSEGEHRDALIRITLSYPHPDNHVVVCLSLSECRDLRVKLERVFLHTACSGPRAQMEAVKMFAAALAEKPRGGPPASGR